MRQSTRNTVFTVLWVTFSCAVHIALFRHGLDMNMPFWQRLLIIALVVAITLPVHELIHCLFMKVCGLKNVTIRFGKDPMGIPSLCSVAQGEARGWRRFVILLSPFLLLTLVPDILFRTTGQVPFPLFMMAICNAAGCSYDLADVFSGVRRNG